MRRAASFARVSDRVAEYDARYRSFSLTKVNARDGTDTVNRNSVESADRLARNATLPANGVSPSSASRPICRYKCTGSGWLGVTPRAAAGTVGVGVGVGVGDCGGR